MTSEVVVVVGDRAGEVVDSLAATSARPVENSAFLQGQSTSVKLGVESARGEAALIVPVDQPALTVEILDRLVSVWSGASLGLVVPSVAGVRRSPVVVGRSLFPSVSRLRGDRGLRQLFGELESEIRSVEFDDEVPFSDVDTPEAWRRLADRSG